MELGVLVSVVAVVGIVACTATAEHAEAIEKTDAAAQDVSGTCAFVDGRCGPATTCCPSINATVVRVALGCHEIVARPVQCGGHGSSCIATSVDGCLVTSDGSLAYDVTDLYAGGDTLPGLRPCTDAEVSAVRAARNVACP